MRFMRSCFWFLCGVYVAQNYNVPDIKELAKRIKESYLDPEKKSGDGNQE